jgi:hypothetical protein
MLVDVHGQDIVPVESAPSMERGANLLAEMLLSGPEYIGSAFVAKDYAHRHQILGDLHELQMFLRETWSALHNYHMANPAPSEDATESEE